MPRFKIVVEYDGTDYCGWQIQPGEPSLQAELESALAIIIRNETNVVGSGRTDAGVHARGQVAHFDTPDTVDSDRLQASLNGLLPEHVVVLDVSPVHDTFHARYDAVARRYRYHVSTRATALERRFRTVVTPRTDFSAMNEAATPLLGAHDFSSFCRTQSETTNRVCNVESAEWKQEDIPHQYFFEIRADRFLHGMVRAIVGTLLDVGRGKRPVGCLADILETRDRRSAGPAAPARGLVLEEVSYN